MNILFILPYCHVPEIHNGPSTGFGIYTIQLAEELAKKQGINLFVLSMKQRIPQDREINGVTYIAIPDSRIALNVLSGKGIKNTINIIWNNYYKQSIFKKLTTAAYSAGKTGEIEKVIKKYAIDVIHIHSIAQELYGVFQLPFLNTKNTLVTMHSDFADEEWLGRYKDYCRETALRLFENKMAMSFVSSGVLERFVKELGIRHDRLFVTVNGTCIAPPTDSNRTANGKIDFVCIGSICDRKNQFFLLKALHALPLGIKERIHVRFIGNDRTEGEFDRQIVSLGLSDIAENCGFVPPEEVKDYLAEADGNIMVSKSEAFGLSVIEGFQYGLPTLTYSDVAAAKDFYSEDAVMLIDDRSEIALAEGISQFIDKEWDAKKIKEWGRQFQLCKVADRYVEIYRRLGD